MILFMLLIPRMEYHGVPGYWGGHDIHISGKQSAGAKVFWSNLEFNVQVALD